MILDGCYIVQFNYIDGRRDEFYYWNFQNAFEHLEYFENDDGDGLYADVLLLQIHEDFNSMVVCINFSREDNDDYKSVKKMVETARKEQREISGEDIIRKRIEDWRRELERSETA